MLVRHHVPAQISSAQHTRRWHGAPGRTRAPLGAFVSAAPRAPLPPRSRGPAGARRALPDPEHQGSHHETDETQLLIRGELHGSRGQRLDQLAREAALAETARATGGTSPSGDAHMRRAAAAAAGAAAAAAGAGAHHVADVALAGDDSDAERGLKGERRHGKGGAAAGAGAGEGRFQVMGLDVTPELCAIALGEPFEPPSRAGAQWEGGRRGGGGFRSWGWM